MPITYVSWNIQYLGPSKLKDTKTVLDTQVITAMADYIIEMEADIVAIMEVTLKEDGTDAVKQLCTRLGPNWNGGSTSNDGNLKPDRYGILYNTQTVHLNGQYWPDRDSSGNLVSFPNRYPTLYHFYSLAQQPPKDFSITVLHGPNPSEEGKLNKKEKAAVEAMVALSRLHYVQQPVSPMIISGDFNVDYNTYPQPYKIFAPLGYECVFLGYDTSLKTKFKTKDNKNGTYLSCAYDNIFVTKNIKDYIVDYDVFDFVDNSALKQGLPLYEDCDEQQQAQWQATLTQCRRVSDHLPVYIRLNI